MCTLPKNGINSSALIMWLYLYCICLIVLGQCPRVLEKCDMISILLTLSRFYKETYFSVKMFL